MQINENITTIKTAISKQSFASKVKAKEQINKSLVTGFEIKELNINEFTDFIKQGHVFMPICLKSNGKFHRAGQFFKQADIFAIDIDNNGPENYLSLADALQNDFIKDNAWLIYTTYTHTEQHHKFRIVFKLPETVTFDKLFLQIINAFIKKFKSDKSCKDAARLFFGTAADGQTYIIGKELTQTALQDVLKEFPANDMPLNEIKPGTQPALFGNYKSQERFISYCTDIIKQAADGEKHNELLKAARLLGGFIAGGLVNEQAGTDALIDEINQRDIKSLADAIDTINDGIKAGKAAPIYYEFKYIIFPCCLLGYKDGNETLFAIMEYLAAKKNGLELETDIKEFITNFEKQHGTDATISMPAKFLQLAIENKLGRYSYNTFKVAAAIFRWFNHTNNKKGFKTRLIRNDVIRRTAAGYKSKEIFPAGIETLTDSQIMTATDILQEMELIWNIVIDKRNKHYAPQSKINKEQDFLNIIDYKGILKDKKRIERQNKHKAVNRNIQMQRELIRQDAPEQTSQTIIKALKDNHIYLKAGIDYNIVKKTTIYKIKDVEYCDVKKRTEKEFYQLLENLGIEY